MISHEDPRDGVWRLIRHNELETLLKQAAILHGHYCPWLALGVRAGAEMARRLQVQHEGMEEVIAIVETNNCFSDGIQFTTGCTFGNNSLIFRDYGKTAASLVRRDGKGVRVSVKPNVWEAWSDRFPEYGDLFRRVVVDRSSDQAARDRFKELSREVSFYVMGIELETLFNIKPVATPVPEYSRIYDSVLCERCHESVMATRVVEVNGHKYCIPCAESHFYELNGNGIRLRSDEHEE